MLASTLRDNRQMRVFAARGLAKTYRMGETEIHALRHRSHPVWGVQFHPESILTSGGKAMLQNFLKLAG